MIGASAALVVLAAPMGMIAWLVRRNLGTPVLFRQLRPGRDGELFTLWKFRTMRDAVDEHGRPLPDAERLTRFGRALRASSLDELPELWNILRGDMSFVGPRPLLPQYLGRYSPEQARRHEVRPGLTGLAQVAGRNALSWPERLALDVAYVDRRSLWLDLKILLATLRKVVAREGISADGVATVEEFPGE